MLSHKCMSLSNEAYQTLTPGIRPLYPVSRPEPSRPPEQAVTERAQDLLRCLQSSGNRVQIHNYHVARCKMLWCTSKFNPLQPRLSTLADYANDSNGTFVTHTSSLLFVATTYNPSTPVAVTTTPCGYDGAGFLDYMRK